jgi:hypothetical protein
MRSLGKARKVTAGLSAFKKIIARKKTSPHNLVSEKEINHQTIFFFKITNVILFSIIIHLNFNIYF